jgi:hypothetical protein
MPRIITPAIDTNATAKIALPAECCANCVFSVALPQPDNAFQCVRFPPTVQLVSQSHPLDPKQSVTGTARMFPQMSGHEFCGEFDNGNAEELPPEFGSQVLEAS